MPLKIANDRERILTHLIRNMESRAQRTHGPTVNLDILDGLKFELAQLQNTEPHQKKRKII